MLIHTQHTHFPLTPLTSWNSTWV